MSSSTLSFRRVPASIYVGLIVGFLGSLLLTGMMMVTSGELYERYDAVERWRIFDTGCSGAQYLLLALGIFELARRQAGPTRTYATASAWLTLAFFGWVIVNLAFTILHPQPLLWVYDWLGRGIGVAMLAASLTLIVAADAWRAAPVAAGCLVVLHITSYWVPGVGRWIQDLIGDSLGAPRLYFLIREAISSTSIIVIAAALAARGRDGTEDTMAAARSFRVARSALVFRVVAAIAIAFLMFGARSMSAAKLALIGGPLLVVVTTVVFAVAIERAGRAEIGLPRLRLAIGVALTLWWTAIQFEQVSVLFQLFGDGGGGGERAMKLAQVFSVTGPIAATIGMALVGSSISSFATARGNTDLAQSAQARTIAFVVASLGGLGLQTMLTEARSLNMLLAVGIASAAIGIIALAMFAGLLRQTAEHLETSPGLPPARIVD